jgi:hypothetical protein
MDKCRSMGQAVGKIKAPSTSFALDPGFKALRVEL